MFYDIIRSASEQRDVTQLTRQPGMLESAAACCKHVEVTQRGLSDYLEMKRLGYPRLFFASREELLEMIVDAHDMKRAQSHLRKILPGIHSLQDEGGQMGVAQSMVSVEGEVVAFDNAVVSSHTFANVEDFFREIEAAMVMAVRRVCLGALRRKPEPGMSQIPWVRQNPAQAVLTASAVDWTVIATAAMGAQGAFKTGQSHYKGRLVEYAQTLRTGESPLVSSKLESLICLEAHHRSPNQREEPTFPKRAVHGASASPCLAWPSFLHSSRGQSFLWGKAIFHTKIPQTKIL